jgi:membrane-associated phospholipid phosphatase
MEAILQWGLDFIRLIQSFASPPLTAVMRIITMLGSSVVYAILLPLVYWCFDEKKGLRLGLAVLISAWVNLSLKFLLDQPRPFFPGYDPLVGMIPERLGGLPSGHAQNSLVLFIFIASWGKKKWMYAAAALCLLIGFSRIYLGVHFPSDVLGGWMLGGSILWAWFLLDGRVEALLARGGFRAEMIAAAALSFIMILYKPAEEALLPGGMVLGMAAGYSLNKRFIGFAGARVFGRTGAAKNASLFARFVIGMAGMVIVFAAFGKFIPESRLAGHYLIAHFLRFAAAAFWVSAGGPWLFCLLRLAGE